MATLDLDVYTSPMREVEGGGLFSPTTSTLILGPTEAVLVDAQYMESDVAELARRIDASGRALTTIYITHAHADHYFGLEWLLRRYPAARAVALPSVVAATEAGHAAARRQWRHWFGGQALDPDVVPEPLAGTELRVDGEPLRAIEVGQGDIAPSTVLHVPALAAVVAGDVAYHGINPFLAASTPDEWPLWIASLDQIAALRPRVVVAGHKRPELADDDVATIVGGTRAYLADFIAGYRECANSRELVSYLRDRYPDHSNPSALVLSAVTAFKHKERTPA